jgi:hypothetical protein
MAGRRGISMQLAARLAREGVLPPHIEEGIASDLIWLLLSIDIYELLIVESGWDLERYRLYVTHLLTSALIRPPGLRVPRRSGRSRSRKSPK